MLQAPAALFFSTALLLSHACADLQNVGIPWKAVHHSSAVLKTVPNLHETRRSVQTASNMQDSGIYRIFHSQAHPSLCDLCHANEQDVAGSCAGNSGKTMNAQDSVRSSQRVLQLILKYKWHTRP